MLGFTPVSQEQESKFIMGTGSIKLGSGTLESVFFLC